MFAPRMPTSSAVFSPLPAGQRLVVEVVHAAARFHDERVAPRPRVVDAGAVGGVGAGAGEAVAGRTALLEPPNAPNSGGSDDLRPLEAEAGRNLIGLAELPVELRVERVGGLHSRVIDLVVRLPRRRRDVRRGQFARIALAIGLMRSAGMTLFGNGVRPVPSALPVSGS